MSPTRPTTPPPHPGGAPADGPGADEAWVRRVRRVLRGEPTPGVRDEGEPAAALARHDPHLDRGGAATETLLSALGAAYERGWQPADVVHAVRRDVRSRPVPLVVALIAEGARRSEASVRAPDAWVDQLRELGALAPGDPAVVASWHRSGGRSPLASWRTVLQLATALRLLPVVTLLLPPPSRWGAAGARPDGDRPQGAGSPVDATRLLRRIRGLLTKAESTEYPEEAEALTAKAQELMTRHSLDAALLEADQRSPGGTAVGTRRVHVDDPYVRAKMQLLGAVAGANDVRLIWYQSLGIANLVGVPADLEAVELLFTSLLLQAGQALAATERAAERDGGPARPSGGGPAGANGANGAAARSFRRAFLLGYAGRIGERLTVARREATASAAAEADVDLLPVLRDRWRAVEATAEELFPRVRSSRSRASVDPSGWYAGRVAADRADVGAGSRPLR